MSDAMAGTKHFSRMNYHVSRGLREIIAPRQTMPKKEWEEIKNAFDNKCAYCGAEPNQRNRGIVADHVIPATEFGEFVKGNIIPACQTCNDSRGNKCWREFLKIKRPKDHQQRSVEIDFYLQENPYSAPTPESSLTEEELKEFNELITLWEALNAKAKRLYNSKHKS